MMKQEMKRIAMGIERGNVGMKVVENKDK